MSQGVQFNRLMLEMRAMQTDAMARAKPEVKTQEVGAPSFSDMLGQAVNKVHETRLPEGQRFLSSHDPGAQQTGSGLSRHHADAGVRRIESWLKR